MEDIRPILAFRDAVEEIAHNVAASQTPFSVPDELLRVHVREALLSESAHLLELATDIGYSYIKGFINGK